MAAASSRASMAASNPRASSNLAPCLTINPFSGLQLLRPTFPDTVSRTGSARPL